MDPARKLQRGAKVKPYGMPKLWIVNMISEDDHDERLRTHKATVKVLHRRYRRIIKQILKKMIKEEISDEEEQVYRAEA